MNERLSQTQAMLKKHHRDGPAFAKLMEESFAGRFGEEFWEMWDKNIAPTLSPNSTVVDLGTGPASFPKALAGKYPEMNIYGVEAATYMVEAAGELPSNVEIVVADLHDPHLSFADGSIDVAVASVVVHEMLQPVRMFQEIKRILRQGGIFYVYDWVRVPLSQYLAKNEFYPFDGTHSVDELDDLFVHFIEHNRFSFEDLKYLLTSAQFKILDTGNKNNGQHAWVLAKS